MATNKRAYTPKVWRSPWKMLVSRLLSFWEGLRLRGYVKLWGVYSNRFMSIHLFMFLQTSRSCGSSNHEWSENCWYSSIMWIIWHNNMTLLIGNEETCQGTMNQIESMNPTRFTENPNAQTHVALKHKMENSPLRRKPSAVLTQPAARTSYVFYLSIAFGFHPLKRMTASWTFGHLQLKSTVCAGCPGGKFVRDPRTPFRWRKETSSLESRLLSMDFLYFKDSLAWWIIETQMI